MSDVEIYFFDFEDDAMMKGYWPHIYVKIKDQCFQIEACDFKGFVWDTSQTKEYYEPLDPEIIFVKECSKQEITATIHRLYEDGYYFSSIKPDDDPRVRSLWTGEIDDFLESNSTGTVNVGDLEIYFCDDTKDEEFFSIRGGYRSDIYVKVKNQYFELSAYNFTRFKGEMEWLQPLRGYYTPLNPTSILVKECSKREIVSTIQHLYEDGYYFNSIKPIDSKKRNYGQRMRERHDFFKDLHQTEER